ncbi:DapH/DapD/GlmU-related protein [Microbacterium sp. NPDC056003]|uniref:DapH/DapD/GlmU-related protein n=1 Tax=Microbacterium sp. NPDC056003 TaxID=3345676 RepID=UPI0035E03799
MTTEIAEDCVISPSARFLGNEPVRIGARTKILRGGEFLGPIDIGVGVYINRDAYVRPNTSIGDRVNIGPFVRLVTDTHEIGPASRRAGKGRFDPITIGDGAWIGAAVTVVGGVSIGAGAVVAAGAVVVSDVPPNTLVGGVPARVIRSLDESASASAPPTRARSRLRRLLDRSR